MNLPTVGDYDPEKLKEEIFAVLDSAIKTARPMCPVDIDISVRFTVFDNKKDKIEVISRGLDFNVEHM